MTVHLQEEPIRHEPFKHPAIIEFLRSAVFNGPTSLGVRFKDHFVSLLEGNDEPELTSGLLAATATFVRSMLLTTTAILILSIFH